MNKTKIIIFSGVGLIVIVFIILLLNKIQSTNSREGNERDDKAPVSSVATEYTYKDMMESQRGSEFEYGDTVGKSVPQLRSTPPDFSGSAPKDTESAVYITSKSNADATLRDIKELQSDLKKTKYNNKEGEPNAGTQEGMAAIRALKGQLKEQQPGQEGDAAEDERIRNIVAAHQTAPGPGRVASGPTSAPSAGFNSLRLGSGSSRAAEPVAATDIKAVILNSTEVATGAVVRIMLLETVKVGEATLPRQLMVSGAVQVEETRVLIRVPGAALNNRLANVAFTAYGTDGVEGLRISQAAGRLAKEAAKAEINQEIDRAAGGGILGGVVRVARTLGTSGRQQEVVRIPGDTKIILKIESR